MKKHLIRLLWILVGVAVVLLVQGGILGYYYLTMPERDPSAPPVGMQVTDPWGMLDFYKLDDLSANDLEQGLAKSIREETPGEFDPDKDGDRDYNFLALSGGGSNGAFGAGVLCGWTKLGTRPTFKVVTGVSTGALQATPAFLGPKYDYILEAVYTEVETKDIYTKRSPIRGLFSDSVFNNKPLRHVIWTNITDEILDAVAAEHRKGRRLYVGTTNMDTGEFSVWDLGAIANSDRPDRKNQYCKVLEASSAMPIFFPPTYFNIEGADGNPYSEMHTDGAMYSQVFFRGFLLKMQDSMVATEILKKDNGVDLRLFVIDNDQVSDGTSRVPVAPSVVGIMERMIYSLLHIQSLGSFQRIYHLCAKYDIQFNLGSIPANADVDTNGLDFSSLKMREKFDLGAKLITEGKLWRHLPPGLDEDEILGSSMPPLKPGEKKK